MNFISTWLVTVLISSGVSVANELRMYKDAADNGYRIDGINLNAYTSKYRSNIVKNITFRILIPFYNILSSLVNVLIYNNNRPRLLYELNMMDALDEMREEEKEYYQKFPTGLRALRMMVKESVRISEYPSVKIVTPYDTSQIYFDVTDDGEIEIIKAYGHLSRATEETQKEKVIESLNKYIETPEVSEEIKEALQKEAEKDTEQIKPIERQDEETKHKTRKRKKDI